MTGKFVKPLLIGATALVALTVGLNYMLAAWQHKERAERLAKAQAMFQQRCKTAGFKVQRTVEGVDGIFLLKVRPADINYGNQFALDDPYGSDLGGDGYIASFLHGSYQVNVTRVPREPQPQQLIGFSYVDALDSKDGQRYRYSGQIEEPWQIDKSYLKGYTKFVLHRSPALGDPPRYGVSYDDISTHEEREYWIAGSSLKVIDLLTNEVVAERIGYMLDEGQGNNSGGRSPWLFAADHACPAFRGHDASGGQSRQAARFVERVLRPTRKE